MLPVDTDPLPRKAVDESEQRGGVHVDHIGLLPGWKPGDRGQTPQPMGVVVDTFGTLYFSDGDNSQVRKFEPDGTPAPVAGTGQLGESGDGGPATEAQLASPREPTFDTAGNLYVGHTAEAGSA